MNIHIRQAKESDQTSIKELNAIASDKELMVYSEQREGLLAVKEYFTSGGFFWVAEDQVNQKIVGSIGLKKIDESTGKVKALRVHLEYRGKGLAKSLMETFEKYCKKNGYKEIVLGVNAKSIPAIQLYESLGFIRDFEKQINQSINAIYYKKQLD